MLDLQNLLNDQLMPDLEQDKNAPGYYALHFETKQGDYENTITCNLEQLMTLKKNIQRIFNLLSAHTS